MTPDLTERERERFAAMRRELDGVKRAEPESPERAEPGAFDPMLAQPFEGELATFDENGWIAERKFDGTRIVLQKFDGEVALYTRRHIDRADTLAAFATHCEDVLPDGLILDGEYCYLTPEGVSRFVPIHQVAETVEREHLSASFFAFDLLAEDGVWCLRESLRERKDRLARVLEADEWIQPVEPVRSGFQAFFEELVGAGEEGIMLKRAASPYHPGVRSDNWRKVKSFTEADVLAVGYTEGEGRRAEAFGALVLTDRERYVGRVGSGFDRESLENLVEEMHPVEAYPVPRSEVGRPYTPIDPLVVRVKFQEINRDGKLRAPVFLGRRTEKSVEAVTPLPGGEDEG